jgi:hypothetical protein
MDTDTSMDTETREKGTTNGGDPMAAGADGHAGIGAAPECHFEMTGEGPVTQSAWWKEFRSLYESGERNQWEQGDALLAGEQIHAYKGLGEVARALQCSVGSLKNRKVVAKAFAPHRRRIPKVTFAHHAQLTPLPEAEQDQWLDRLEGTRMSVGKLRRTIQEDRMRESLSALAARARLDEAYVANVDFREWLGRTPSDLILVDPPWGTDAAALYPDLFCLAAQSLRPGKVLALYVGLENRDEIAAAAAGVLRSAGEIIVHHRGGAGSTDWSLGIQGVQHHTVLLFTNDGRRSKTIRFVGTVIEDDGPEKDAYRWQASLSTFRQLVEKLSEPGDLVLDPMCGTGTTLVAALQTGRDFLGSELDPKRAAAAQARVDDELDQLRRAA